MYHFVSERTAELRLSNSVLVPSQTTQYLKPFQLTAVRFLYERLSKHEFCVFNDESGLGKSASIAALLSGLGAAKKTLIVLQHDEDLLAGWRFHLSVLTDLPVCVIKDASDTVEAGHSVYLCKWNVLRSICDLSKLRFDYIIVDHRGYTLNNNFCTSMLLKQFERKVNIVISSVDVTSEVKLIYNVMQLGGCLEHQYSSFKAFESKFHLPDVKEVLSKRVDLEEYYKQRGVLGEFIKDFRLRRYRHQFEAYLPLVTPEQYKRNLSIWLGDNNSNSTLSGSTVDSKTSEGCSTGGSDNIFECLKNHKQQRQTISQQETDKICLSDSNDAVAMEPLVFDSESEPEQEDNSRARVSNTQVVLLSSDDCEIVVPPTQLPKSASHQSTTPTSKRMNGRRTRDRSEEVTESETEDLPTTSSKPRKILNVKLTRISLSLRKPEVVNEKTPKLTTDNTSDALKASTTGEKRRLEPDKTDKPDLPKESVKPALKTPKKERSALTTPKTEPRPRRSPTGDFLDIERRQTRGMQRLTRSADTRTRNKYMTLIRSLDDARRASPKRRRNQDVNRTPKTSKPKNQPKKRRQGTNLNVKIEPKTMEEKSEPKKRVGRPRKVDCTEPSKASNTKTERRSPETKSTAAAITPKRSRNKRNGNVSQKDVLSPVAATLQRTTPSPNNRRREKEAPDAPKPAPTPELLSSGSIMSDNSYLQCAQKLPENLADLESLETLEFRVPNVPQATPLMLPMTLNLFSESEVVALPSPNHQPDIVVVNSSHDESSPKNTQSRRTRALKRKRPGPAKEQQPKPSTSSFGLLLAQQRGVANKSPDIFSSCSDASQVMLAQPVPFEGFKIFGSEVKQQDQYQAKAQSALPIKKNRERSCLDLLENMFEPQQKKSDREVAQPLPHLFSPKEQAQPRRFTLLDDDIFEITNNGEFGSRLRVNSTGNVSPVHQSSQPQRNKITNYLISSGGTPEDSSQRTHLSQLLRKSLKALKPTQPIQSTKLTRWFNTSSTNPGESRSAPSTPVVPPEKAELARAAHSGGSKKRKRLDMDKFHEQRDQRNQRDLKDSRDSRLCRESGYKKTEKFKNIDLFV